MASIINASATGVGGVVTTADASGQLALQGNGTTVATATSTGFQVNTYSAAASLITSGTSVASTSGTSIDFTGIPSWVKRITVMFNGVSLNGTANFLIQLGSSSIPKTSEYVAAQMYVLVNGTAANGSNSTAGFPIQFGSSNYTLNGSITFNLLSSNIWVSSGVMYNHTSVPYINSISGSVSLSGTLNIIRITTTNGTDTFDAGSINILYE